MTSKEKKYTKKKKSTDFPACLETHCSNHFGFIFRGFRKSLHHRKKYCGNF